MMAAPRRLLLAACSMELALLVAGACPFTEVHAASRAWKEPRDGKGHFQLLLRVPDPWRPFAHVVLEWADQPVKISSVEGARVHRHAGTTYAGASTGLSPHTAYSFLPLQRTAAQWSSLS